MSLSSWPGQSGHRRTSGPAPGYEYGPPVLFASRYSGISRRSKDTRMTVEIAPITDADVPAVADLLHSNLNSEVPWADACSGVPWKVDAPNHGYLLRDGQLVVGACIAFYSDRLVAGRMERFCNIAAWYVEPAHRFHSISLLKALLGQEGYNFTFLSGNETVLRIIARLGGRSLDVSAALIPNLPWPTVPVRTRISSDPDVIEKTLGGPELDLYRDHARALAVHHHVLIQGKDSCYVMYREFRHRDKPLYAVLLHVSNREIFHRALLPLTRHLLIRHRLVATMGELRIIGQKPRLSFALNAWPKMYRSASLEPEQIDNLYSELVCVPWSAAG